MKRYRFVVLISLLLAVALMACQPEEVVETATPVPPTPTVTPQALEQLGVSEVVVESLEELTLDQEIVLTNISALVVGEPEKLSEYLIYSKIRSVLDVDPIVFQLPLQPLGDQIVNPDDEDDLGVQVYTLKIQESLFDQAPLSGEYATLAIPPLAGLSLEFDPANNNNIISGWMLVWAADNQQTFSIGSGEDGLLFTEDDPLQPLELGYTAMLVEDGVITRFRGPSTRVVFSINQAPLIFDLSGMDSSDAYDEVISVLEEYYPEWDDENISVMENVKTSYPDEELQFSAMVAALEDDLVKYEPQEGGYEWLKSLYPADYGMIININEDDEVRAYSIRLNGPADEEGLRYGDEILKVNGQPVLDAIDEVEIPFISVSSEVLQKELKAFFLFRSDAGKEMELEIKTIKGETKTISMEAESNSSWLIHELEEVVGYEYSPSLPVEYYVGENYGYLRINDFDEDPGVARSMFINSMKKVEENEVDYLILDYQKAEGSHFLELAGYFLDEDLTLGSINCLDDFTQPVVVHPAEKQFDFKAIAVITGEACSGACEMEVLAMQQLDNVITYGLNNTGGSMNIGPQAQIWLPGENQISFPVCQFSSDLVGGKSFIEPEVKLTNSYYAAVFEEDLVVQEAFANLLFQNNILSVNDEKLPTITSMEMVAAYFGGVHPDIQIIGDIESAFYYHDVNQYDLYGVFPETKEMGAFIIPFCSTDLKSKVENMKNSTLSVYLDEMKLTDFTMKIVNFENNDIFGRYKDRPCMVWAPGFMELIPGHHLMKVVLDVQEPIYYNDSYFETGTYEVDVHFLVLEEEAEESIDD